MEEQRLGPHQRANGEGDAWLTRRRRMDGDEIGIGARVDGRRQRRCAGEEGGRVAVVAHAQHGHRQRPGRSASAASASARPASGVGAPV